jgi:sigma-B regulation protein RsbU (phosphoserine phosphatase)
VTEGQTPAEMWRLFVTDARSSYRLYARDASSGSAGRGVGRYAHLASDWFWAILTKLTPVRRLFLLAGLVFLALPREAADSSYPGLTRYGGMLILLVLVMELADRVIMKRDLEIAREIQQWLVPAAPPSLPSLDVAFTTRPANTVSGDYYDVFPWSEAPRQLIVMADVAGKSVPAALLMATFHASLHSLAGNCATLIELVTGVNRYACAHSSQGRRFITAFLAVFDPESSSLTYINAGHNAPILRRASGAIERLEAGGVPLGIVSREDYLPSSVALAPGDILIVFTDGVVEATNPAGQEFGDQRLLASVGPECTGAAQMLQFIMYNVDQFVRTAPQQDDITCLVARRK